MYECLDADQVVSPIHFNKNILKSPSPRNLAYRRLEEILEEEGSINPYQIMLLGPEEEESPDPFLHMDFYQASQPQPGTGNTQNMENWSVLSTEMHYNDPPQGHHSLMVLDCKTSLLSEWEKSGKAPTIDQQCVPETSLMKDFMDKFDSVTTKINTSGSFQDNRDVSTTYLGSDVIQKQDHFTPEVKFPITSTSHTWGQLVGGNTMNILMDTGASKCYMSRAYFERNKMLHGLPRLKSTIRCLRVGNGNEVNAHFVIPIVIKIAGHKFEIYALVSEIQPTIDLVLGMKNMHELEGELSPRNSEFRFLNRAVPLFTLENFSLKPGSKRFVKFIAPFPSNLTGLAIVKLSMGQRTITVQCKLQNNLGILDMINTSKTTMLFSSYTAFGIVDIRSLGYFNIKHVTLQYNLSKQLPQYNKIVVKHADQLRSKHASKHGKHVKQHKQASDPYPWLDSQDPRRNMTDEEILRKYVDLSQSILNEEEKEELMQIILKHKSAFSLRDEIGECPNIKIDIDVIDDSPFFVRPFPISEEDKPIMDKQMQRLVSLKILSKNTTSHTSPVMLITRKVTKDKRPVVDFRLLNTRIKRHNTATPLLRDIYQMLGKAQSTVLSCVDLKDAFHSLRLTDKAKDFCGILPYFGSPHYRYEVMPMGLSISPCKWIQYIGYVMEKMPHPENYIAIMDDLLVHSRESEHMDRILDMLKALVEHGLKLSPKKCQFFRSELVYMGNTFQTGPKGITITPIKTRTEAILNTPTPKTPKECKSFCGVVNYVSLFCPHLQELIAPIYDLTRKGRPFIWTTLHQNNFDKIKKQMASLLENRPLSTPTGDKGKQSRLQSGLNPLKLQFNDKLPYVPDPALATQTSRTLMRPMPMQLAPQVQGQVVKQQDVDLVPEVDPNMEIPLSETSVEAMFQPPDMKDFTLPQTLSETLQGKTILAQTMPRQVEIDRLMKQLNRKILTQTRFPSSLKDLEAAYCSSSAFKDIFQFLKYNKLPGNKTLAKKIQSSAQDYFVIGSILFKYLTLKDGTTDSVMCIPPSKMDIILDHYHSQVIGGHQGITKTLKTLSTRYYCPRMADYIRAYIVGCHLCQLFKNSKRFHRPFMKRTYDISQPGLANVSMDIKYMPKSNRGFKFLLVILCEITNFLVTHPMKEISAENVCTILVDEFISYFSTPIRIVCDQDPSFMSTLCQYCFQQYKIQLITVSVTNHKSLLAEHGIKSLSNMITTHLTGLGKDWHVYAKPCMLTYNSYHTPNLDDHCPFELVFGRRPRIVPILEVSPPIPVTGTFKQAYEILNKKLRYFRQMLIRFRDKRFEVMNRSKGISWLHFWPDCVSVLPRPQSPHFR